jgi:hypothetical protein
MTQPVSLAKLAAWQEGLSPGGRSVNPGDRQLFNTIAKKPKRSNQRRTRILQGDNEVSTVGVKRLTDIGFRWIGVRDGMRMVNAQMFLIGCSEILEEPKQILSLHRVSDIAFQHVLHWPTVGDDLTLSHEQAAALPWGFLLGMPDNGFQDLSLDLNRRHKKKGQPEKGWPDQTNAFQRKIAPKSDRGTDAESPLNYSAIFLRRKAGTSRSFLLKTLDGGEIVSCMGTTLALPLALAA